MLRHLIWLQAIHYAMSCLSMQSGCSSSVRYQSASCNSAQQYPQAQYAQYAAPQTGAIANPIPINNNANHYQAILGNYVTARAYSGENPNSEFVKLDKDLSCPSARMCSWRNMEEDQMDWLLGEGRVDTQRLSLIAGSDISPEESFLILGSTPRPSLHAGLLVSPTIGCQQSSGLLTFRYWRSRARVYGDEPDLDICTRSPSTKILEHCTTMSTTPNHTIVASIPPILQPFQLVLKGYGFENEPEGGLILIDKIEYYGHVDTPDNCSPKDINSNEIVPLSGEAEGEDDVLSEDIDMTEKTHIASNEVEARKAPFPTVFPMSEDEWNEDNSTMSMLVDGEMHMEDKEDEEKDLEQVCRSLQCLVANGTAHCDEYKRTGEGSKGDGYAVGWKIASLSRNFANKLTGIVMPPVKNDYGASFLVAEFIGFALEPIENRFVLEAPQFTISDGPQAYLSFKKYLATKGVYLSICEDYQGNKCFWNVYTNSLEPLKRNWTQEVVLLPGQITRFYIISWQSLEERLNFGQVGLTEIGLYRDPQANEPLC